VLVKEKMEKNQNVGKNNPETGEVFKATPAEGALVSLFFSNYGTTHLYTVNLLFSLKHKKFIKPVSMTNRGFEYRVLPGEYIVVSADGNRDVKIVQWKVQLVRVSAGNNKTEVLKEVMWETPLYMSQRSVPILKDIRVPDFHEFTGVSFNRVYSDDEVNQLLQGGVDQALMGDME